MTNMRLPALCVLLTFGAGALWVPGRAFDSSGAEHHAATTRINQMWLTSLAAPHSAFHSGATFGWHALDSANDKKYVCPPCGCESDGQVFDKPGACPSCEMELVEKPPEVSASAAAALPESVSIDAKSFWVLEPPPAQGNTAAYMTLENKAAADVTLTGALSDAASALELHTMETDSAGLMRMRKVEGIRVPAGGTVELKPGGLHLMLIGLRRELRGGEEISLTLLFSDSTKKSMRIPVRKRQ